MSLVDFLKEGGPERAHNIDNMLLRESMDVIGAPSAISHYKAWRIPWKCKLPQVA